MATPGIVPAPTSEAWAASVQEDPFGGFTSNFMTTGCPKCGSMRFRDTDDCSCGGFTTICAECGTIVASAICEEFED